MLIGIEDAGTPHAEAIGRLLYSSVDGFEYHVDLDGCSHDALKILSSIDGEMASFADMNMPHTIDNWQELEKVLAVAT